MLLQLRQKDARVRLKILLGMLRDELQVRLVEPQVQLVDVEGALVVKLQVSGGGEIPRTKRDAHFRLVGVHIHEGDGQAVGSANHGTNAVDRAKAAFEEAAGGRAIERDLRNTRRAKVKNNGMELDGEEAQVRAAIVAAPAAGKVGAMQLLKGASFAAGNLPANLAIAFNCSQVATPVGSCC